MLNFYQFLLNDLLSSNCYITDNLLRFSFIQLNKKSYLIPSNNEILFYFQMNC